MKDVPSIVEGISLSGQHAIVTGATNGIGRAIAQTLAHADAAVTVLDLTEQPRDGGKSTAERRLSFR